jgi:hypothetical protein
MYLDLDLTFSAAVSLALANALFRDFVQPVFVELSRSVLEEMSLSGNLPARDLSNNLETIIALTSTFSPPPSHHIHSSFISIPFSMFEDGQELSDAILGAIEIEPLLNPSSNDPNLLHAAAQDILVDDQRQQIGNANSIYPSSHATAASRPSTNSSVPQSQEFYTDTHNASDYAFSFDTEDLLWLDAL